MSRGTEGIVSTYGIVRYTQTFSHIPTHADAVKVAKELAKYADDTETLLVVQVLDTEHWKIRTK